MDKMKIGYLGKKEFAFSHGGERATFAPGEVREVPRELAEMLLGEQWLERKWTREGKLREQNLLPLFAEVIEENAPDGDAAGNDGEGEKQ